MRSCCKPVRKALFGDVCASRFLRAARTRRLRRSIFARMGYVPFCLPVCVSRMWLRVRPHCRRYFFFLSCVFPASKRRAPSASTQHRERRKSTGDSGRGHFSRLPHSGRTVRTHSPNCPPPDPPRAMTASCVRPVRCFWWGGQTCLSVPGAAQTRTPCELFS